MPSLKLRAQTRMTTANDPVRIPSKVPSFAPQTIAYFKVLYNGSSSPTYSYDTSISGYYDVPVPGGIDTFTDDLRHNGHPTSGGYRAIVPTGPNGLDFELDLSLHCYVLFHLDGGPVWQYRFNADGIEMDDTTPNEYINLVHVDQHGHKRYGTSIVPNPGITTPPDPPYRIAYFSAFSPSAKGTHVPDPLTDGFNLWVYKGGINIKIDPAIKNDGHTRATHVTGKK